MHAHPKWIPDPNPIDLDPRTTGIIDPPSQFTAGSTEIIYPISDFVAGSGHRSKEVFIYQVSCTALAYKNFMRCEMGTCFYNKLQSDFDVSLSNKSEIGRGIHWDHRSES